MYNVVLQFSEGLDIKAIVPSQLPLLIEFLASSSNAEIFESIETGSSQQSIPFQEEVESIDDSLLGTVFGSFLGYSEIEYEKGGNVSTVKAISDYKKETATKPVAAEVSVSETN